MSTTMSTVFGAHVITAEADIAVGNPEIIVMIHDDSESGEAIPVANYPISDGEEPADLLRENGWRIIDDPSQVETVPVEPADYEQIVKHVTFAREKAQIEYERQDTAWRAIIRHAMHDGASATALAKAAGITRARVYQIRDGRR